MFFILSKTTNYNIPVMNLHVDSKVYVVLSFLVQTIIMQVNTCIAKHPDGNARDGGTSRGEMLAISVNTMAQVWQLEERIS